MINKKTKKENKFKVSQLNLSCTTKIIFSMSNIILFGQIIQKLDRMLPSNLCAKSLVNYVEIKQHFEIYFLAFFLQCPDDLPRIASVIFLGAK